MPTGGTDVLVAAGLDAATAATVAGVATTALEGAGTGALLGGGLSALEGGNVGQGILHGAESGALTGGGIGIGGDLLGGVAGSVLGGAGGGALGGLVTGQGAGTGALEGAASGGLASVINGNTSLFGSPGATPGAATGTPTPDASLSPAQVNNAGATAGLNSMPNLGSGASAGATAAPSSVGNGLGGFNSPDVTQDFQTAFTQGQGATAPLDTSGLNNTIAANPSLTSTSGGSTTPGNISTPASSSLSPSTSSANPNGNWGIQDVQTGINNITANNADLASNGMSVPSGSAGSASPTGNTGFNLAKSLVGAGDQGVGSAFTDFLGANAGLAVPAAVLGYDALENSKQPKGFNELKSEAGQLSQQGSQLEGYLQSGTLPPGLQGAVQQNLAATQAAIRSQYASKGMSGSSAEQQDLQNAAIQSQSQSSQLALSLLQQGVAETGDAAGIYENLIKDINSSDQNLSSALAAFAAAASGQGGGQTLKITTGN